MPEGLFLAGLCANKSPPESFVSWAFTFLNLKGGPVSTTHLNWYLHGNGADFIENRNIEQWIARDSGLRAEVARHIRSNKMQKQPYYSSMDFESKLYDNMEYYYAFGRIEALFIDFDINVRYVTISFKDIYEWHPICEPYYTPKPGDRVRDDNSLHAAMVEMKEKGARDYWMIGEATRPMSDFGL